jgi:hypothetical protein
MGEIMKSIGIHGITLWYTNRYIRVLGIGSKRTLKTNEKK